MDYSSSSFAEMPGLVMAWVSRILSMFSWVRMPFWRMRSFTEAPVRIASFATYGLTVGPEFLSESNRDRVLQLCATHLQDIIELLGLIRERLIETLQLDLCLDEELEHGDLTGGWEDVVRGLTAVHVIVRIYEGVVALFTAEDLDRTVRDDLVRVHVEARACAALDRVDDEGVAELVGDSLIQNVPKAKNLLFYKLENRDSVRQISFYYKKNRYVSRALAAFLEMI